MAVLIVRGYAQWRPQRKRRAAYSTLVTEWRIHEEKYLTLRILTRGVTSLERLHYRGCARLDQKTASRR